jgi:hypothetical protein
MLIMISLRQELPYIIRITPDFMGWHTMLYSFNLNRRSAYILIADFMHS